ncbi:MAG: GvpL/GvpF family gas vesicle protein [Pseudomonadota bacterium]
MQRYVYGIIRTREIVGFDVEGLGSGTPKPESIPIGDGLAMITTPFDGEKIRPSRKNMLAHTRVLEHVMTQHDVLPMRFGTVLPAEDEGEAILNAHKQEFQKAFEDVEGHRELSLKVFWKDGVAFREIMEESEELRTLRDNLAKKDPAQSHYERIEFGKKVEAQIAAKRAKEADDLKFRIQHICKKFAEGPINDDVMIANFSFLVDAEQEAKLDETVNLLDEVHCERLSFRYVGPMPPFSFVELKIDPVNATPEPA